MVLTRVFVENNYFLSLPLVHVIITIFIYRSVDGARSDLYYCELNSQTRFGSYTSFPCTLINTFNWLPYIFLQKPLVNAVTHECGSPPHFKIISGKLFFTNFTPLTRPFVWNLQNWNACDIHFNVIDGVSWTCSCVLFRRQYRPWFVKFDPAPEIDGHFFSGGGAHWRLH